MESQPLFKLDTQVKECKVIKPFFKSDTQGMSYMSQLADTMNMLHPPYTSRSQLEEETDYPWAEFLLNQITANRCIFNLKSPDSSKIGATGVRNRDCKHVDQDEVFKEQHHNGAGILIRRIYFITVEPQGAPAAWTSISFLTSLLDMVHFERWLMMGVGRSELWIPWD